MKISSKQRNICSFRRLKKQIMFLANSIEIEMRRWINCYCTAQSSRTNRTNCVKRSIFLVPDLSIVLFLMKSTQVRERGCENLGLPFQRPLLLADWCQRQVLCNRVPGNLSVLVRQKA